MGNMRLRYRIPLAVIAILMVITLSIGSSYALWKVTKQQSTANVINTGCFQIDFREESSSINLTNTYPLTDEKGLESTTPYIFTVTNTCTIDAAYTIYLNTLKIESPKVKIDDKYIDYSITKINDTNGSTGAVSVLKHLGTNGELYTRNVIEELPSNKLMMFDTSTEVVSTTFENAYAIETGTLKKASSRNGTDGGTATYSLRLWIDKSATKEINSQVFKASIYSIAKVAGQS